MNQFINEPKYSPEIETQILGALILDEKARESIGRIKAEYFYSAKHQVIFSTIREMAEANEDIDLMLISQKLQNKGQLAEAGSVTYLISLLGSISSTSLLSGHIKSLITLYKERELRKVGVELENVESEEVKIWCSKMTNQIEDFRKGDTTQAIDMADLIQATFDQIEYFYQHKGEHMGLKAGLPYLSKRCPLIRKDMIALGGAPSAGKTALAMTLLWNIAKLEQKHVLFFSCEMSKESVMMRFYAMLARIDLMQGLMSGGIEEGDWHKITSAAQELRESKIIIDEDSGTDIEDIIQKTKDYKLSHPDICFVVVDQIKFVSSKTGDSREERTANISGRLKTMAKELDVNVMVLTQLLKEAVGRKPIGSDIKNSGALLEDSDVTWLLYRDKEKTPDRAELIISKQRNGVAGIFIELGFKPEHVWFYQLAREESHNDHWEKS